MSNFEQDQFDNAKAQVRIDRPNAGPARRRNGADSPVGRTVFQQQIEAMAQMTQKLYHLSTRVGEGADAVMGPRDAPSPGDSLIRGNPGTVQQSWTQLCEAVDEVERQVNRFYD